MGDPVERGGLVLNVQRLSTEDGPGISSTVFLKTCPLSCRWCHNPESISGTPQAQWFSTRCIGCAGCVKACPRGCIVFEAGRGVRLDRACCDGCGACAEQCPSNALEMLGKRIGVEALVKELSKDRAYYESSGGGVTISGGEPLAQPLFTVELLKALGHDSVHTALDTCGFASTEAFVTAADEADLILFDLKAIDPAAHKAFTGQSNQIILRNLATLGEEWRSGSGAPHVWIRTPLIPGATATPENLLAIGSFLAATLDGVVERWELCAFNNLCRDQYVRLGMVWDYATTPLMSRDELDALAHCARSSGVDPRMVLVSGTARTEHHDEKEETNA
jgi:pyruvate formate lyase activating enzyme